MHIVALIGSPRKNGSTARLAQELIKGAEEKGATATVYHLNDLNIRWCQSCNACVATPAVTCAIQDDVKGILADISEADGVLFATPVYMSTMSAQMKALLDRLRPFTRQDNSSKMSPGKKAVWAVTQRNPDGARYLPVFETVMFPMKFLGFGECKLLVASGTPSPEHLLRQEDTLSNARALGRWLAE